MKRLLENRSQLGFLVSGIGQGFLTNDIKAFVNSFKIDKAARILYNISESSDGSKRDIREKYSYTQDELQLEATVNGYSIQLPQTPLDVLVASADLRNCLTSYMNHISEKLVVLTIFRAGKLQGAIEVDMRERKVVQAKGRYNAQVPIQSALNVAITMWMHEKNLEYSEW